MPAKKIGFKKDVMGPVSLSMRPALMALARTAPEKLVKITITGTWEGEHTAELHHIYHEAIDIGTSELSKSEVADWVTDTKIRLAEKGLRGTYNVLQEVDRIHIQHNIEYKFNNEGIILQQTIKPQRDK